MIVKKELAVSAEEYFNYIVDALQKELKKMGVKGLKKSDLKPGYTFVKKYKQGKTTFEVNCTIIELERPSRYHIRMEAPSATQSIHHTITKIDDEHVELEYEESIETNSFFVKLRKVTQSGKARRNMERTLGILEQAIIDKREEK